mgnify:FL=1
MGAYRSCPRCGRIHKYNEPCPIRKVNYSKDTKENGFRSTRQWRNKSLQIRELSGNVCAVCLDLGMITYNNLEVHHIEPLEDRFDLRLEDSNLICLCSEHHHQAERGEIDKSYLKRLVEKRDEMF